MLRPSRRIVRAAAPLYGAAAGAGLGVALFLLAALLHDRVFPPRGPEAPPAGFAAAGDPRGAVAVHAGEPAPGVAAVLLPLREDGGPSGPGDALLDEALFPGQPPHRWYRLVVSNGGTVPFRLDLAAGGVALSGGGREVPGADLAAAFAARRTTLSPHRVLDLVASRAPESSIDVAPGASARVLVAFPGAAAPGPADAVRLRGATGRLAAREVTAESVRTALLRGEPRVLEAADRAEARGPGGARRPGGEAVR